MSRVYVLLPPSETKHPGGTGPALDLDGLSFPALLPIRAELIGVTARVSADPAAARAALKVSANLDAQIEGNTRLLTGPTMPAIDRYTGVLYAAMNAPTLSVPEATRAGGRVLITSALFGLLSAGDRIPAYRLSANSRLPGLPTIAALWRPALALVLADLDGPVLDLRSGAYAAFAPVPGAITVSVATVTRAGAVKPVSHDNKAIKGALARLIATSRAVVDDVPGVLRLAYRAGMIARRTGPASIELIAPPVH